MNAPNRTSEQAFSLMALAALLKKRRKAPTPPPVVVNVDLSGVAAMFARKMGETEIPIKHGVTPSPS